MGPRTNQPLTGDRRRLTFLCVRYVPISLREGKQYVAFAAPASAYLDDFVAAPLLTSVLGFRP